MLGINIICIGKLKEKYWLDATAEYMKRLGPYCDIKIQELKEERLPAGASAADERKVIEAEGKSILGRTGRGSYIIALDMRGRELDSEQIAAKLNGLKLNYSTVDFIIGGSLGLSDEVRCAADFLLSFGRITLPHQLARVVLLEQIYRACRINAGETYHK